MNPMVQFLPSAGGAGITKQRGENNGTFVVPGSYNDALPHQLATVTFTLTAATDVLIIIYALMRGASLSDGTHTDVLDNGTSIIPGEHASGSGAPMMLFHTITEQNQFGFCFVVHLAAGTHVLSFITSAAVGTTATNVFDGQISAWY